MKYEVKNICQNETKGTFLFRFYTIVFNKSVIPMYTLLKLINAEAIQPNKPEQAIEIHSNHCEK